MCSALGQSGPRVRSRTGRSPDDVARPPPRWRQCPGAAVGSPTRTVENVVSTVALAATLYASVYTRSVG